MEGENQRYDAHSHATPLSPRRPGVHRVRMWGSRAVAGYGPARQVPHREQTVWRTERNLKQRGSPNHLWGAAIRDKDARALGQIPSRRKRNMGTARTPSIWSRAQVLGGRVATA
jgi:hypothetical protein